MLSRDEARQREDGHAASVAPERTGVGEQSGCPSGQLSEQAAAEIAAELAEEAAEADDEDADDDQAAETVTT